MKKFLLFGAAFVMLSACSKETPTQSSGAGNTGALPDPAPGSSEGFGVSGLLFENNLIMYDRSSDGERSELFSQMYFTRIDADDFPVWNTFPSQFIVSGGVKRDGIPALTRPRFAPPETEDLAYLHGRHTVLGLTVNGVAKAYPHNILWWHEIINDQIGGQNVTVTLCPLTGTGMVFRAPGRSNTIDQLELLPVIETTWERWLEMYPNSTAVSGDTQFQRDYTQYPYGSYRQEIVPPLFGIRTNSIDPRFAPKQVVLGLFIDENRKAYAFSALKDNPVVNDVVGGTAVLIISEMQHGMAIPYSREIDGQILTFSLATNSPFTMVDDETGSSWDIKGRATAGPLTGTRLTHLPAHNAFWFAWSVFWPQTEVFE